MKLLRRCAVALLLGLIAVRATEESLGVYVRHKAKQPPKPSLVLQSMFR